ncbi:MAG: hypothetical protein M3Y12_02940 [Bacteroidota bacterium]|nr:hypothetical protein [Bacteroidota bacterium]
MIKSCGVILLIALIGCNKPQPTGRQVSLAKGNVLFVLPDTTLVKGNPILYPADTKDGSYGEVACLYHSPDSTTMISVYVTAMPASKYFPALPWRVYADEKQDKYVLMKMNQEVAVIERYVSDSISHAVEIDYRLPKRSESGHQGVPIHAISLTIHGRFRRVKCNFSAADNAQNRQMLADIRNSIIVNPAYLAAIAKRYPEREYQD